MPALVHLALATGGLSADARRVLESWAASRQDCCYTVVQEETDDHLSLSGSGWPLVDHLGRLRFRTSEDPLELHVERHDLQSFIDAHRAAWHALGLVGAERAEAPLQLGDTFALRIIRPRSGVVRLHDRPLLRASDAEQEIHLVPRRRQAPGSLPVLDLLIDGRVGSKRTKVASTDGLAVDITWDARQAGKIAQLAAFSGVLGRHPDTGAEEAVQTGDLELITDGVGRQLRAFAAGLGPDEALSIDADEPGRPRPDGT